MLLLHCSRARGALFRPGRLPVRQLERPCDPLFRFLTTKTSPSDSPAIPSVQLSERSLIRISGPDTIPFLQGLITTNIVNSEVVVPGRPIYTAFLNAQGRVLHDVFLYPPSNVSPVAAAGEWYIELHHASRDSLLAHLRKHKLRSKLKLESVSQEELGVHYLWPSKEGERVSLKVANGRYMIGGLDQRPGMGTRWIIPPATDAETTTGVQLSHSDADSYTIHRILNGVAEGPEEIVPESALPQESNIDYFGGIDFRKGCYLGQELTIRTHHTGVVRKRILPMQIYDDEHPPGDMVQLSADLIHPLPLAGANISRVASKGRSTGKWLHGLDNIGLGLCRLEMMSDIRLTDESATYDAKQEFKAVWEDPRHDGKQDVKVKAFIPPWMRAAIEAGIKGRERKNEDMET
jgi:folate-binding protein YgfZ